MDLTARQLGLIEEALLGQNSTIQKHVEILRNNTNMDSAASALMQLHWEIAELLEKIRAEKEKESKNRYVLDEKEKTFTPRMYHGKAEFGAPK